MKSEEKNFTGRIIPPWYDSDLLCIILINFSVIIFSFGISGVFIALGREESYIFLKIPLIMTILSFYLCFSVSLRLLKRRKVNKELESMSYR
ncbi:MAG: hypothetical protein CSB21_00690 [Deltaproteobacteria bacterium]|nr:MAG: hypothetical protein CSB21_00690 [Deltaproteobacteria bacterium]